MMLGKAAGCTKDRLLQGAEGGEGNRDDGSGCRRDFAAAEVGVEVLYGYLEMGVVKWQLKEGGGTKQIAGAARGMGAACGARDWRQDLEHLAHAADAAAPARRASDEDGRVFTKSYTAGIAAGKGRCIGIDPCPVAKQLPVPAIVPNKKPSCLRPDAPQLHASPPAEPAPSRSAAMPSSGPPPRALSAPRLPPAPPAAERAWMRVRECVRPSSPARSLTAPSTRRNCGLRWTAAAAAQPPPPPPALPRRTYARTPARNGSEFKLLSGWVVRGRASQTHVPPL
ncbi:hypothetical protein DFH27DRAFT_626271 [Peziza echinospora]|nr:hypothetical protein DFH27DRAFT_626271 [Peziza echinospora]